MIHGSAPHGPVSSSRSPLSQTTKTSAWIGPSTSHTSGMRIFDRWYAAISRWPAPVRLVLVLHEGRAGGFQLDHDGVDDATDAPRGGDPLVSIDHEVSRIDLDQVHGRKDREAL